MNLQTHLPNLQPRILKIKPREKTSRLETGLSILALFVLLGIGAAIFGLQFRHNRANDSLLIGASGSGAADPGRPSQGVSLNLPLPDGIVPWGPTEHFSPENLSDKINGKAELYLSSGVKGLTTRRFRVKTISDAWIEIFQYDMGRSRNAFAVYSAQMRDDAVRLELTTFSYRTENGHFFLSGSTYVEIIGSGGTHEEVAAREALGEALVGANPGSAVIFDEFLLFPEPNLIKESISLISDDAFGFEGFDNVFTAAYDLDGTVVTAFVSRRESPSEATKRALAYDSFLLDNGGKAVESRTFNAETVRVVEILDAFELIVTRGAILAGVREAPDQMTAEKLGQLLVDRIAETQRTSGAAR